MLSFPQCIDFREGRLARPQQGRVTVVLDEVRYGILKCLEVPKSFLSVLDSLLDDICGLRRFPCRRYTVPNPFGSFIYITSSMRIPDGGQEEGEVLNLDIIAALGQIVAVLTVIGGIFSYAVIRPLNESIRPSKDTVDEMREEIKEGREQRQGP